MGGNSANMIRKTSQYLLRLVEFNVQSNYFWLVDRLHVLFHLSIPPSTRPLVRNVWLTIKILTFLQYTHHMVQLFRTAFDSTATAEEFITIFNMCIVLTTALGRAACLAYHRSAILSLKGYINSKNCLRDDPLSFELRKATFVRNIKLTAVFTCYTTLNATYYYFTEFRTASVFRMPLPPEVFPARLSYCIETLSSVVGISWSVVLFISLTQFGTLLNSLCTELTVIVQQFDGMFEQVVANCALNTFELAELNENERTKFWSRLDSTFTNAISHHSSFVSHHQRLKSVSSANFFILLISAALMITVNTFMFMIEPSLGRLPLQVVAIQFILEVYVCCNLFDKLEKMNNKIARYVYVIDWFNVLPRDEANMIQGKYRKSIFQNALLLQRQVHGGFKVRAGGMFDLNLNTFANLINLVYSMLTFLLKMY